MDPGFSKRRCSYKIVKLANFEFSCLNKKFVKEIKTNYKGGFPAQHPQIHQRQYSGEDLCKIR